MHRKAVLILALLGVPACKARTTEIVVFHASSLASVLGDAREAFEKTNPQARIRLEPSGSQVAVRKVTELGMRADIVTVADGSLIQTMMIPSYATWNTSFATNEIVLAHKDHSKWTDQISERNWAEILSRDDVRLGRADPDTAPIGYQTLMVWQLAEAAGLRPGVLVPALLARCTKEHVVHDEAELLALLESRAIDYAFLFRSTAEDHHLKILSLPAEINLSRPELASRYAVARVAVRMQRGQGERMVSGAPIVYGLTVPTGAPQREEAARFVDFLLSGAGLRLLSRRGFHPLVPATCHPCAGLPSSLVAFSAAGGACPMKRKWQYAAAAILALVVIHVGMGLAPAPPFTLGVNLALFFTNLFVSYAAATVLRRRSGRVLLLFVAGYCVLFVLLLAILNKPPLFILLVIAYAGCFGAPVLLSFFAIFVLCFVVLQPFAFETFIPLSLVYAVFVATRARAPLFTRVCLGGGLAALSVVLFPLIHLGIQDSLQTLWRTFTRGDVASAIWLSLVTSTVATAVLALWAVPLAYALARVEFPASAGHWPSSTCPSWCRSRWPGWL